LLDDYCLELTSVSRYPDTSHRKFVAYTTIDVSAHTNYLDLIFKELLPGTVPDKERKLYARIDGRQH
jgi:hypothetical protein